MGNEQQLGLLKKGVNAWNHWRQKHEQIRPDLSGANLSSYDLGGVNLANTALRLCDLSGANLMGANLRRADLGKANLSGAYLSKADFFEANLSEANLSEAYLFEANLSRVNLNGADLQLVYLGKADLRGAYLIGTDLQGADLRTADLEGANLMGARLLKTSFEEANLSGCSIYGISCWSLNLEGANQSNLIITPAGEPGIMVDNLEVAQFISLLLINKKIREVINSITSKIVLILGAFTLPERKEFLAAIQNTLRSHHYSPVVFDFEKSGGRDVSETLSVLAKMAQFIIADLSDTKDLPSELQR